MNNLFRKPKNKKAQKPVRPQRPVRQSPEPLTLAVEDLPEELARFLAFSG